MPEHNAPVIYPGDPDGTLERKAVFSTFEPVRAEQIRHGKLLCHPESEIITQCKLMGPEPSSSATLHEKFHWSKLRSQLIESSHVRIE